MSETMDFSDMFRGDGETKHVSKPRLTSMKRAQVDANTGTGTNSQNATHIQENIPPVQQTNNAESDSMAYVKNSLKNLNIDVQTSDLSHAALQAIEMLYKERSYWQKQSTAVSEECVKLRNSLSHSQREKAKESETVEILKRENQQQLSRISSLTLEHREVKNNWLAEKSDLQTRIFQIQAHNTQTTGSLKKRDKDFEKLQNQLAKIVKEANKSQAKPAIIMSLPVKKNLSQETGHNSSSALSLLKDSEIQAAKKTILTLDTENQSLRASMEILQHNMDELNESFESAVQMSEEKTRQHLENILAEHVTEIESKEEQITTLQQQLADALQTKDAHDIKVSAIEKLPVKKTEVRPPTTPSATTSTSISHMEFMSPSQLRNSVKFKAMETPAGSIAKRYLEGTPGARPVQWVVEQANTEVKRLRARAEQIARGDAGAAAMTSSLDHNTAGQDANYQQESTHTGSACAHALWRMKLNAMKLRLSEALIVIQEQDRLIHSALSGRPVGMGDIEDVLVGSPFRVASEKEVEASPLPSSTVHSDAARIEVMHHLTNFTSLQDSDFLPPASPATWELLQSYGWSCLPNKSAADSDSAVAADGIAAAAEGTKATLAGEFEAED